MLELDRRVAALVKGIHAEAYNVLLNDFIAAHKVQFNALAAADACYADIVDLYGLGPIELCAMGKYQQQYLLTTHSLIYSGQFDEEFGLVRLDNVLQFIDEYAEKFVPQVKAIVDGMESLAKVAEYDPLFFRGVLNGQTLVQAKSACGQRKLSLLQKEWWSLFHEVSFLMYNDMPFSDDPAQHRQFLRDFFEWTPEYKAAREGIGWLKSIHMHSSWFVAEKPIVVEKVPVYRQGRLQS